jgi:hypothetical protein
MTFDIWYDTREKAGEPFLEWRLVEPLPPTMKKVGEALLKIDKGEWNLITVSRSREKPKPEKPHHD